MIICQMKFRMNLVDEVKALMVYMIARGTSTYAYG